MLKTFATLAIAAYAVDVETTVEKSRNVEMDTT